MSATHDTDVVVAGAGPVGLALALALARRGVRSIVVERKAALDTHSRATLLVPRALEIIDELGLLAPVLEHGRINRAIEILRATDRRPILTFDFGAFADRTATPFAVAIPQDRTEALLLDAARTTGLVEVRFDEPLRRFADDPDGVTVDCGPVEAPARLRARYLVGADGAHSTVRTQLGWTLDGTTYPTRAFLADVRVADHADLDRGWPADPDATSFTLAVRFGDGVWRLIESAIPAGVDADSFADRARALTDRVFGRDAWRETLWTAAYQKHERRAQRFRAGRVILAGDAAHLNSPAGGQGLNAGLQDAHSLAWRIARIIDGRGDADTLLESYTQERTRSFDADVRTLTGGIERMETSPAWLRRAALSAAGMLRATPLPRIVAARLSMLDPTLTPSVLLAGAEPVGRRLPNVLLPDGSRLYDHLRPGGLLLSGSEGAEGAVVPTGVERVAGTRSDVGLAALPELPAPFPPYADVFVRPDHVVAVVATRGTEITDGSIARALGDAVGVQVPARGPFGSRRAARSSARRG